MKRTATKGLVLGALLGLGALAADTFTTFQAGTPIRAAEVNANFSALRTGLDGKQNTITGSPCQTGQFVKGIGADGALSCGPDQIAGGSGAAGVSSLNGKTGSLALEAGSNIRIDSSQAGKLIVSGAGSTGGGGGSLTLPFTGASNGSSPAFSISNTVGTALSGSSTDGNALYAISSKGYGVSAYSESSFGVVGFTGSGIAGVYGESKVSGAAGVRGVNSVGPGSSGVWGESVPGSGVRGSSSSGTGVLGESERGYGVRGTVSASGTGVYGENISNAAGAGVQGRADAANSVGVGGISAAGTGVQGTSGRATGVRGSSGSGGTGVEGSVTGSTGYGVKGTHTSNGFGVYGSSPSGVGVGGESANSVAVQGTGPVAMKAVGNAVQAPGFGGWAKGMVVVDVKKPAGQQIVRCYNSQLTGAAMNTVPCGYSLENATGQWRVIFGFDTRQTFASATLTDDASQCFDLPCKVPVISGVQYENDSVVVLSRVAATSALIDPEKGFTLILY
ncbi:hypothetical protein [Deinococcus humi]|uniref:Uncharacterized protein n=1 Tax=Deinococcus humi TaxID=662880 RepID=A0A7W8JQ94_9DEIO|nr:hypothetical protein [Deinococcus humi]MBB5360970.1 hypothetical protein [Deinococcus humi]GGO17848.1 hypothetical protein GCM10008949_00390 [Deinococcus humi]